MNQTMNVCTNVIATHPFFVKTFKSGAKTDEIYESHVASMAKMLCFDFKQNLLLRHLN